MGCDIHSCVEVIGDDNQWQYLANKIPLSDFDKQFHKQDFDDEPFSERMYSYFGFLAGVRNYSCITPISEPRGLPANASSQCLQRYAEWEGCEHSGSWLLLSELLSYNYDQIVEDRRCTRTIGNFTDGAALAEEGQGVKQTLREFLGQWFFDRLNLLATLHTDPSRIRIVFWFDN